MSGRQQPWPYSEVGPALPQALRLARCQANRLIQCAVEKLPTENDIMNSPITREEERILAANASVVIALEDLFSWKQKDRTSRTSKLSFVESWRFQRTLYRIWLLSHVYGQGSVSFSGDYYPREMLEESLQRQTNFLEGFDSRELLQIRWVALFLRRIGRWAMGAEGKSGSVMYTYDFDGLYVFSSPRTILRCYEEMSTDPMLADSHLGDDGPYTGFLMKSLEKVFDARGETPDYTAVEQRHSTILDTVNGEYDCCSKCGSKNEIVPGYTRGPNLLNDSGWDYLKGELGLDLHLLVHPDLQLNPTERDLFKTLRAMNYHTLIGEMFDSKQESYKDWSRQDWLCSDCISTFFTDTIPFWWLERRRREGKTINTDCDHGWDCLLQKHLKHAEKFNHLCKPLEQRLDPYI